MYHSVHIPLKDKHVHRYLWRDLEKERDLDTYVKTVLTFGDKLAPAMAQIALQKTAEEKQGHAHQFGHNGAAATTAKMRIKYWIVKANDLAKSVKYKCVFCKRMAQNLETQFMADRPDIRLAPFTPSFHNTTCDYFGPIVVKIIRNNTAKHYGILFTCLNTRAVHLELVVDCSTMEFLQVLRRFFAIRGSPAVMISDNGTQFVGAEKELKEMVKGGKLEELREFCAEKGMERRFTTPKAPHHNGYAEVLVKTCEKALKKAIGNQVLSLFELYMYLLEAANLVNSRPIGKVPNDPDDGTYISPNDILLGHSTSEVPQGPRAKIHVIYSYASLCLAIKGEVRVHNKLGLN